MEKLGYKWDGQFYQDNSAVQYDLGKRAKNKLDLKGSESVLDIGCGNGMLMIELAKRVPYEYITAIELSKNIIKQVKTNLDKNGIETVKIVNMNIENINFIDQFDIIFSNSAIHFAKNLEITYKAIYKALKKTGRS